ncbi:MAG TPA: response regulator [Gemmataceae bacterium]|nr:response regulator [Gemmataceae bacterium]
MSSIRREAIGMGGSSVGELLEPSGDVVDVRRIGDSIECGQDGSWLLRVLVVDDNHDCADSLSTLVHRWGHDVQTAYDGAAALEMMDSRQPDVALVDLAMPNMDGLQMARRLRKQMRFNHTLLIAITGYADQEHRVLCDEAGFDHYLVKPIDLADLEKLLLGERDRLARFSRRE